MKHILFIAPFFAVVVSCSSSEVPNTNRDSVTTGLKENQTDTANNSSGSDFKNFKAYQLAEPIIADLDGDKIMDTARFERRNEMSGVVIVNGRTKRETVIGCGNELDGIGDDFSWVDSWGLLSDENTYNTIIKEGEVAAAEKLRLDNPGIVLTKEESGGGVITFKDGRYIWVHQTC